MLAVIRNKEGNEAVQKSIRGESYIGLTRPQNSDQFTWADGGSLDNKAYSSWAEGNPSVNSSFTSVIINKNGLWTNVSPDKEIYSACSMDKSVCPDDYDLFEGICYFISKDKKSFEEARTHCNEIGTEGAFLASIYVEKVNDFLKDKLHGEAAYFGLFKDKITSAPTWSDGSILMGNDYKNWEEDSALTQEDCVGVGANGKWNYYECNTPMKFVCQIFPHVRHSPNCNFNDNLNWLENPETGMCLLIMNKQKYHSEAEDLCRQFSKTDNPSHLVSIHSPSEQHFLTNAFIRMGQRGSYWIGFRLESSFLTWTDMSPMGYTGFVQGADIKTGCAKTSLHESVNKWIPAKCDMEALPFICAKRGKNYVSPDVTPSSNDCPKGWVRIGEQCLHFSSYKDDYDQAKKACAAIRGSLAYIGDAETNTFIQQEIRKRGREENYLFGLNDIDKEGSFVWQDGSELRGFNNWADNFPTEGDNNKNCVEIGSKGRWKDFPCTYQTKFICSLEYSICPSHWHPLNQRCFYTSQEKLSFTESEKKCTALKSQLASIHSEHENIYLSSKLAKENDRFWLGVRKDHFEDDYLQWTDGSELDYSHFMVKRDAVEAESVFFGGSLDVEGYWRTAPSNESFGYACSKDTSHYMSCPKGWKKAFGSCYLLGEKPNTFDGASKNCRQKGGYLVRIEEESEQDFLLSDLEGSSAGQLWIGLTNKRRQEKFFHWEDGSEIIYSDWDMLFPDQEEGNDCVVLSDQETRPWRNVKCSQEFGYMCETPQEISEFPPESEGGCTHSQVPYQGSCFEMFLSHASYAESKKFCEDRNAHLLKIKDLSTQARLVSLIHNSGGDFFLGLEYNASSSSWIWLDGSGLGRFSNWGDDEPRMEEPFEDLCAIMTSRSVHLGIWKTAKCSRESNVICQSRRKGFTDPPVTTTPMTTLDPKLKCPPEYKLIGSLCYGFSGERQKNFEESEAECFIFGGHLVAFEDEKHQNLIMKGLSNGLIQNVHFGLREFPSIGGIHWLNPNYAYGGYTNWASGQPNSHSGSTPCGHLEFSEWVLGNCLQERSFICEVPPRESPFPTLPPEPTKVPYPPCDEEDWFRLPGSSDDFCYKYEKEEVAWQTALHRCRSQGSELVSLHKSEENNLLWRKLSLESETHWMLWIGISNLYEDGGLHWTDGSPLNYLNWEKEGGGEDQLGMGSCGQMLLSKDGTWSKAHCTLNRGFVCKKPHGGSFPSPSPTPPLKGHCKEGIPEYKGHCYTLQETPKSWESAHSACRNEGSDLVSVHSAQEMSFLSSRILLNETWLGLKYLGKGGTFGWSDESPMDYSNWAKNEPSDLQGPHNCIFAYADDIHKLGKWAQNPCTETKSFICKSKVNPSIEEPTYTFQECPSNQEFIQFNGEDCFLYVEEPRLWSEAEAHCQTKGSHLIAVHESKENALVAAYSDQDSWIGLSYSSSEGELIWSDGSAFTHAYFEAETQIDPSGANYVFFNPKTSKWRIASRGESSDKKSFWCGIQKKVDVDVTWVGQCPEHQRWQYGPLQNCFYFGSQEDSISYEFAASICKEVNGTLGGIHSRIENEWLRKRVENHGHWIGIERFAFETGEVDLDNFFWVDEEPYKGNYHNWVQGYRNQEGVVGEFIPQSGQWSLENPTNKRNHYICSVKKVYASQPPIVPNEESTGRPSDGEVAGIVVGVALVASIIFVGFFVLIKSGKLSSLRRSGPSWRRQSYDSTTTNVGSRMS